MSLVDLKSDLSKYRSEVSKEEKNSPNTSSATNNKNFATNQPITDDLINQVPDIKKPTKSNITDKLGSTKLDDIKKTKKSNISSKLGSTKLDDIKQLKPSNITGKLGSTNLDDIKKPKPTKIQDKLSSTKLDDINVPNAKRVSLEDRLSLTKQDDIVKTAFESLLINSVSQFSPQNVDKSGTIGRSIPLEEIQSKFSSIRENGFTSKLNASDTEINKITIGENNTKSNIDITKSVLSVDRTETSPDITKNFGNSINNITDPKIVITPAELSINREEQSLVINKNLLSPIGNVTNPLIPIKRKPQTIDRTENLVEVKKDVISTTGNIIDPDTKLQSTALTFNRVDQTPSIITDTIKQGLAVNPNIKVLRIEPTGHHLGDESEFNFDKNPIRYVGISELEKMVPLQEKKQFRYVGQTIHDVDNSQFNLDGITPQVLSGRHEKPASSLYSVIGLQEVNYFANQFAIGFNQKQRLGDSKYIGFSQYGWTGGAGDGPFTNYFADTNGRGFQIFVDASQTLYEPNSSRFTFFKTQEVNFFDAGNTNTLSGFTSFTPFGITQYKTETSFLGWQGNREGAPTVNYFDLGVPKTTDGFSKFVVQGDSKYVQDSSILTWSGNSQQSPAVNYFDLTNASSNIGFHTFASFMDSKYIQDASRFDWDGNATQNAPTINYFDITNQYTSVGFHPFAQKYDSKYIMDSSIYNWDGNKENVPSVNYFDLNSSKTTAGFESFAQMYDSKYIQDASRFDWGGNKSDAPAVNYFDLTNLNSVSGFNTFVTPLESKYKRESSFYTWNTTRKDAPTVNNFDLAGQFTKEGFHKFAELLTTKYIPDSSGFDWDGKKAAAPAVNYFDLTGKYTTVGFHTFPTIKDSKYISESSEFDWDGSRTSAPAVNYFDLQSKNTTVGFHTLAPFKETKYIKESSEFDWDGGRSQAPAVNYFDLQNKNTTVGFHILAPFKETKYIKESSEFDWDGARSASPEVNFFDLQKKNTSAGFHRLAELLDTKYVKESSIYDWDGGKTAAPEVNYFDKEGKFSTAGFHREAKLKDSKYTIDSSEFTFTGKYPGEGVNYFDKESLNQKGFTLNIQAKGTSKPPGTEYNHESSFYTFIGNLPTKSANWFQDTNQKGFTQEIQRNASTPETEYSTESSRFGFRGSKPSNVANWFSDDNQTGFTLDIMRKGSGRPGTEYKTDSSQFGFKDGSNRPSELNFFPDDNQSGFTLDIMPKGAGNPGTEYKTNSSRFSFKEDNRPSPVNFFPDDNQSGFTLDIMSKGSGRPGTEYKVESSTFTWKGTRIGAPSNNYFGLYRTPTGKEYIDVQQKNNTTQAGRGFKPFSSDKTQTNFASGYSIHSTEGGNNKSIVLNKPVTNFFGYTPLKRDGFLPKMTQSDGTLYPIITPDLRYDSSESTRISTATARGAGGLTTTNGEKFAPLSLGKHPWSVQGFAASLENQVPTIKTNAKPGSFINKYERTMKDTGLKGSYLYSYSETGGELKKQYTKFSVVDDSYNKDSVRKQPFITRGFQTKGNTVTENWTNPNNIFKNVNDKDVERITKWLETSKGKAWQTLQETLYKQNPLGDTIEGKQDGQVTRVYNKGSLIRSIQANEDGSRELVIRHGSTDIGDATTFQYYEKVVIALNKNNTNDIPRDSSDSYSGNRLIALMGELLPSALIPVNTENASQYQKPTAVVKINRLSGKGGPNSGRSGNGETTINRSSHPTTTVYDTSGVMPSTFPSTMKRDVFFGAKLSIDGNETDNTYSGKLKAQFADGNKFDGLLSALSYLLEGGKFENDETGTFPGKLNIQPSIETFLKTKKPFDSTYTSFVDRTRATGNSIYAPGEKILEKIPSGQKPTDAPHKQYSTVAYSKLKKVKRGEADRSHDYNDFRHDIHNLDNTNAENGVLPQMFSSDPKVMRYHKYNLDVGHGFGKQGEPGNQRNLPFKGNVIYKEGSSKTSVPTLKTGQGYKFRGDRINIIDFKRKTSGLLTESEIYETDGSSNIQGVDDLVTFYFSTAKILGTKASPAEAIVFRAAFDSITDNHKPSWSPVTYIGRGDPIYTFSSYERDVSFGFTVHIGSRDEMKATWRKLNYLASWTAPEYVGGQMKAPICRLNIGHLFRKTPGFINSLSYTFDNVGSTWETAQLKEDFDYSDALSKPGVLQLPKTIQVSCGFTVIGTYRPEKGSIFYPLYDDTGDGLAPKGNQVNYFRTFDEPGGRDDDYVIVPLGETEDPADKDARISGKKKALTGDDAGKEAEAAANLAFAEQTKDGVSDGAIEPGIESKAAPASGSGAPP